MKFVIGILALALMTQCSNRTATMDTPINTMTSSFYDLSIPTLEEDDTINFENFKGKKILLVNVASKCGFTGQYEGLQKLSEQYADKLVVIGFPCNQFLFQEPGSSEKIRDFCTTTYGVSFPLTTKIKVKGDSAHPVYQWLTKKEYNGVGNFKVSWNFNKFLIDEAGNLVAHYDSKVKPFDPKLIAAIEDQ